MHHRTVLTQASDQPVHQARVTDIPSHDLDSIPRQSRQRWLWAAAMPAQWALGWTATTLGQIHVEQQFTIFGAYGALTFSALSGLLLHSLLSYRASAERMPEHTRVEATT